MLNAKFAARGSPTLRIGVETQVDRRTLEEHRLCHRRLRVYRAGQWDAGWDGVMLFGEK